MKEDRQLVSLCIDGIFEVATLMGSSSESTGEVATISSSRVFRVERLFTDVTVCCSLIISTSRLVKDHCDLIFDKRHDFVVQILLKRIQQMFRCIAANVQFRFKADSSYVGHDMVHIGAGTMC